MAVKRTLEEIDREIEQVKAELENLHGTETEVYARIVGYYRAVRNWNKGKRDEYNLRKMFTYSKDCTSKTENKTETEQIAKNTTSTINVQSNISHFEFYMRQTCPNCPPVKSYIQDLSFGSTSIDVDTEEGLRQAAEKGVFSAPTVIFYDNDDNELGRAHNVEELEMILKEEAVLA